MLAILRYVQDVKPKCIEGKGKVKLRYEELTEVFRDIEAKLCEIMSKMISAPITRNMPTICSRDNISAEQAQTSFEDSKAIGFPSVH